MPSLGGEFDLIIEIKNGCYIQLQNESKTVISSTKFGLIKAKL